MSKETVGYRQRLKPGDRVYVVEGASRNGVNTDLHDPKIDPLVVKEGIVTVTGNRKYPFINIQGLGSDLPILIRKSPRAVFTPQEVARYLRSSDLPTEETKVPEDLIKREPANKDIIAILGSRVLARMADDFVTSPFDPESADE